MVDPQTYIEQGLKIVKTLVSQGNFQAALNGCGELLKVNPYDRDVQKVLKQIEEKILSENIKKVDNDIESTMHLWKEGRYDDLMKIYSRLYQYAPSYGRLRDLIEKLNSKLSKNQQDERENFVKKALDAISAVIAEKRYGDAIQACNELLGYDPLNEKAAKLLAKSKNELIEQKLKENERITDSADFERSLDFYTSLLAIDPNNAKVKKLALQAKIQLAEQRLLGDKIHLNESIVRMKDLFKSAEYEKVIQACDEIARLDANNLSAKIFRTKAEKMLGEEADRLSVIKLKEVWGKLEPEYKKNPEAWVRV
jgi:tetratricopeptide (TPR) repeat protein